MRYKDTPTGILKKRENTRIVEKRENTKYCKDLKQWSSPTFLLGVQRSKITLRNSEAVSTTSCHPETYAYPPTQEFHSWAYDQWKSVEMFITRQDMHSSSMHSSPKLEVTCAHQQYTGQINLSIFPKPDFVKTH